MLSPIELFGLRPFGPTLQQALLVFRGDPSLPKSRFDTTSLNIFTPRLGIATWMGIALAGRTVPITNLYNRTPTPYADGWSVRVTQVQDFRGGALTYDSHNGTDLVVPPGTVVVAAAPGRVCALRREWNRGGLKIYVDHGDGLMTSYHHLGRALVDVGDVLARGQPLALSAYSGADGMLAFPWSAPHIHFNVYMNGVIVDPFAAPGETSLWRNGNAPTTSNDVDAAFTPTTFDPARVDVLLGALRDDDRRRTFAKIDDVDRRAFELLIEAATYPTRFDDAEAARALFATPHARAGRIDLPLRAEDFDGSAFADDLGLRRTLRPAPS